MRMSPLALNYKAILGTIYCISATTAMSNRGFVRPSLGFRCNISSLNLSLF